jgi:SAM-dependent methyltransferase
MQRSLRTVRNIVSPFVDPPRMFTACRALPKYVGDLVRYRRAAAGQQAGDFRLYPILGQDTTTTEFDAHYVCLGEWAFRHIVESGVSEHVDVGAQINWITCLATVVPTVTIDIRPLSMAFEGLESRMGSILAMPFPDRSVASLSCLHVAEHIGLGRYGDPLDPLGTRKAVDELARVVAPGGRLYFGLPIGRPQVFFNAHRVHDPRTIVRWFADAGCTLHQFSAVSDARDYRHDVDPASYAEEEYACGMFCFTRPLLPA